MDHTNIVRSFGAIALGACCALGTLVTLFWSVRSLADLTTNHILILLALLCALGSAHFGWRALREWRLFSAVGFFLLFAAGTFVCAIMSAGRGAETLAVRKAMVTHADAARLNHEREIAEARVERDQLKAVYDKAQANAEGKAEVAAAECKTGKRLRCEGTTFAADQAKSSATESLKRYEGGDARYWQLVAQLDNFKPTVPANMELRNASRLWAIVTGYDEAKSVEALELLWPLMLSFLTEIGTVTFLHYGLEHRAPETKPTRAKVANSGVRQAPVREVREPKPIDFRGGLPKQDAQGDLMAYIAQHGSVPNQEFLRRRWQLRSRGTVSDWLSEWERKGLICRHRDGHFKVTSSRTSRTTH